MNNENNIEKEIEKFKEIKYLEETEQNKFLSQTGKNL
jgi:hypothetical protein